MAKKPASRRRRRKYLKGSISDSLALGTLANEDVISGVVGDVVAERSIVTSVEVTAALRGHTAGEGPIEVGVAHSDYSAAEIEEYLENAGSWDEGDLLGQEVGKRKIRQIGMFDAVAADQVLFDGRPKKFKLNWVLNTGQTIQLWAYNRHNLGLTTGSIYFLDGHANLFVL